MPDVLAHAFLLAEVDARLPLGAGPMENDIPDRTRVWIGHKLLENLLFQYPQNSIVGNDVMEERDAAKDPAGGGRTGVEQAPRRRAKDQRLDQQPEDARHLNDGRTTIVRDAEDSPQDRGQERQPNRQQIT